MSQKIPATRIRVQRAYQPPSPDDGARILVERLWPRGVRKQALALTAWDKALAPSTALRQWYGHEASRWDEFRQRYAAELRAHPQAFDVSRRVLFLANTPDGAVHVLNLRNTIGELAVLRALGARRRQLRRHGRESEGFRP